MTNPKRPRRWAAGVCLAAIFYFATLIWHTFSPPGLRGSVQARLSSSMIAQNLLVVGLVGALLMEVISSPVSFPTDGPQTKDLDEPADEHEEAEGRFNHAHHREKKKRKRQRLACLAALQQQTNRYRRETPANGDGRTLFWGGFNYYDTDIHVYNGGYGGSRPSYAPGVASNPSNPCQGLPLFSNGFPSLGNFPSLPNFSNIGNEIVHVFNPGTTFPGSLPGSSSSSSTSSSGIKPNPGGGGGPSLGGGGPSTGSGNGDGDNTNEDYDYSDGGTDSDNNRIKKRRKPQRGSSFLQPVDRYLDQFLFKPVDRTFQRLVRWF